LVWNPIRRCAVSCSGDASSRASARRPARDPEDDGLGVMAARMELSPAAAIPKVSAAGGAMRDSPPASCAAAAARYVLSRGKRRCL